MKVSSGNHANMPALREAVQRFFVWIESRPRMP
jgi:hypothetical protein